MKRKPARQTKLNYFIDTKHIHIPTSAILVLYITLFVLSIIFIYLFIFIYDVKVFYACNVNTISLELIKACVDDH